MKVWIVGAGPGDPELLTVKARRLIEAAEVLVFAGSLVPGPIVDLAPSGCRLVDSSGLAFEEITAVFEEAQRQGRDVVRLHSGDPSIYGAIGEQMDWLTDRGIGYEIVPGVSSFLAAAAAAGRELTAPGIAQTVVLTRMGGRTPGPDGEELRRLCATRATVCLFLSAERLSEAAEAMLAGYGQDVAAVVVEKASRPDQRLIRAQLSQIALKAEEKGIARTALLLAGPALESADAKSLLYSSGFSHGYRKAKS